MSQGIFITGTDTAVGKTYFTAFLTRSLQLCGIRAIPLKPISTGDRSDAQELWASSDGTLTLDEINPIHFSLPLAPWAACQLTGQTFPKEQLRQHHIHLQARYPGPFLVEGVGGWRVPLAGDYGIREWATELRYPVVVVARAGLGTLNHTLLTVDSIRQTGLPIAGIVLNQHLALEDEATRSNPPLIEKLTGLPVFLLPSGSPSTRNLPPWLKGMA